MTSERTFRWINTKITETLGIAYDPVPFAPGLGADYFGHMVVMSDDSTGVAYLGLDVQEYLHPIASGIEAHFMVNGSTPYPGYEDRLRALMSPGKYPIRNNGYVAGSLCSENKECESKKCASETSLSFDRCVGVGCVTDKDCDTGRCDSGVCLPKRGSCMPCDEDSDCAGGNRSSCLMPFFRCTNEEGKMDEQCSCRVSSDCRSGRCEGLKERQCEARLALGGKCNEHSDCLSGYCSWGFICESRTPKDDTGKKSNGAISIQSNENTEAEEDGPLTLVLYTVLFGGAMFLLYKFVNQNRGGYSEVSEMEV